MITVSTTPDYPTLKGRGMGLAIWFNWYKWLQLTPLLGADFNETMKYSDGMCKICTSIIENTKRLLAELVSLDDISNETMYDSRLYWWYLCYNEKKHKIAGYFQNNEGTAFIMLF